MCHYTVYNTNITHFHVLNIVTFDHILTSVSLTEKYPACKLKMHVNFHRYITKKKTDDFYSEHPIVVIFKPFHFD